jgi:hypothetical protein
MGNTAMAMNKRKKGNAFQDWIEHWFLDRFSEVAVHNQKTVANKIPIRNKVTGITEEIWISKRNDVWGCIDLLVLFPDKKPLFIQATLDTGITRKLQDLLKVKWPLQFCHVQVWVKRPDGIIVIKQFTGDALIDKGQIIRRKYYQLKEEPNGNNN